MSFSSIKNLLVGRYPKSLILVTLLSSIYFVDGHAQSCANYTVSTATGITYSSIFGTGTSSFIWRNTNSNQYDDNRSYQAAIGFDFWYLGVRYTQFSVSLNGIMDFSTSTSDGNTPVGGGPYGPHNVNQFSTANQSMLALAPMYGDLWTGAGGTTPPATCLIYKTTGSAPNRVLTVEWINFDRFSSATGTYNFQVKIYETTGVIEFIYGTMVKGAGALTYATGINGNWAAGGPTAALLLTQQTISPVTFGSTAKNNLDSAQTSNTKITFTPPAPTASPTGLSFSGISKVGMTLNWTDNASNELGYVVYISTDATNYTFRTQVAANSTSAVIIGLFASTTYHYRVYAVTEGDLGTALAGTQATSLAGTIISIASTNWSNTATWDCTCIPTEGDHVIIANSTNVVLDTDGFSFSLTVGQGTSGSLTLGDNASVRNLLVRGNVTVNTGASLTIGATNATHVLTVGGDIVNSGTLNLAPTAGRICNVTFNNDGNQSISGSGATCLFSRITLSMGSNSNRIMEVSTSNFTVFGTNFLTINNGIFKVSAAIGSITPFTGNVTIPNNGGIWLNHTSSTMTTTGGTITLFGIVTLTNGTFNIGSVSDNSLTLYGGAVAIDGGTMNIAGRLDRAGFPILSNFSMSNGTLNLATVGSTTAALAPFTITEVGSTFNMSGGTIVIKRTGAGNLAYINTGGSVGSVTGGMLKLGDGTTPGGQTMTINSNTPIYNLSISNGVDVSAVMSTSSFVVNNNFSLNSGSFEPSNQSITVNGNSKIYGTFSDNNAAGTTTLGDNVSDTIDISSSIINGAATGIMVINGTTMALSGSSVIGRFTLTTNVVKIFSPNIILCLNNTGVKTIQGLLTIDPGATWNSTSITTAGNLIFQNGIVNNGSFDANVANFITNNQSISGPSNFNFGGNVLISGAITVQNISTGIVSIVGTLNGSAAGSTWLNDNTVGASTLEYGGAAAPMLTGVLNASTNSNTVHYNRDGAQNVKSATYWHLIMSTVAASTKTLVTAAAIVNGNFTLNALVTFDPVALSFTANGHCYIFGIFGDSNTGGTNTLGNAAADDVDISGGTINGAATGVMTINGTIQFYTGDGVFGRMTITVVQPCSIPSTRTLLLNNNNGIKTFQGLLTVSSTSTFNSTAVTTAGLLFFQNGIANTGSFSANVATFNTNSQSISGNSNLSFGGNVLITGAITVTNENTAIVSIVGTLNGSVAGSTWRNHNVVGASTLDYSNAAAPMITGVLNASTDSNTVHYSRNGAQNVKGTTYWHLILSTTAASTKTLVTAAAIVNGDFIANTLATFNPVALNFTANGISSIIGSFNDNNNGGINTFVGAVTIDASGSFVTTTVTTAGNLLFQNGITNDGSFSANVATFTTNNQSLNGSSPLSFSGVVRSTGINVLNNNTVNITSTAAGSLVGTGTWTQGINSTLNYAGSTITLPAAGLIASAAGNTIDYNLASGNQTIFNPQNGDYYNLIVSNTTGTARTKTLSATTDVLGNLSISGGSTILSVSTFDMFVGGNWSNSSTNADPLVQGTRKVTFNGSNNQTISNTGNANATVFNDVDIVNTSLSGVTLNAAASVGGVLTLTDGYVFTDSVNVLTMLTGSSSNSGSAASFVDGPMLKVGTTAYEFPIGNNGRYARLAIGIPSAATTFYAEYIEGAFYNTSSMALSPTPILYNVSKLEHWKLHQVVGTGNATVQLFWENAAFSVINDCSTADLRVAHWNGSAWENNNDVVVTTGACTGTSAGTVRTNAVVTSFSPFTFGSKSNLVNGLPITLISFTGKLQGDVVYLDWETASEINNDFFTLEKSTNGKDFKPFKTVDGSGNSHQTIHYNELDTDPYSGVSYYRLKQTDFNGDFSYSHLVAINNSNRKALNINVYPNPTTGILILENLPTSGVELKVFSIDGSLSESLQLNNNLVDINHLQNGVYILQIQYEGGKSVHRIVKQ